MGLRAAVAPAAQTRAAAFDGFAILDARPVGTLAEELYPVRGSDLAVLWLSRQFEYAGKGQGGDQPGT